MIDGKKIREIRRNLGISQKDLADGITTQGTISALERNSSVPSSEVLAKILIRLGLTFDDIVVGENEISVARTLSEADRYCMNYEYDKVLDVLNNITENKQDAHYLFLKTNAEMWQSENYDNAIFGYNLILQLHEQRLDIFTVLAICELGVTYSKKGDKEKSNYYFKQIPDMMEEIDLDQHVFWTLFLYDNLSKFYSNINDTESCLKTLGKAIDFAKKQATTFFLDQYYFLYATEIRNKKNGWDEESISYLIQAHSFANFLENDKVIEKTIPYLKDIVENLNWNWEELRNGFSK